MPETMKNLDEALGKRGLTMPRPPPSGGLYENVREFGPNLAYLSGVLSHVDGKIPHPGKINQEVTVEQAVRAAEICAFNLLANIMEKYGSLDRVKRIVKMTVYVVPADGFYALSQVSNGASQVFVDVFGRENGLAARSTIAVASLVGNGPVEIEVLIELHP